MFYSDLIKYLESGSEQRFQPPGPLEIPHQSKWRQILRPEYAVYHQDIEEVLETLGPTVRLRAAWVAIETVFSLYEEHYALAESEDVDQIREWLGEGRPILDWFGQLQLRDRSSQEQHYWDFHEALALVEEIDPQTQPGLDALFTGLLSLIVLLTQISTDIARSRANVELSSFAVVDAAIAYSHLMVPGRAPHEFDRPAVREFIEWWWEAVRRRIAERGATTDGPSASDSRNLREYYEEAFKKWKDKKGYVLWDSVKGVFDSVFNTSDFRKLTNSLGLPITHIPGIGKALKAVGNFVLRSLWIAPKMARAVVEETGLPPEKVEKVFAVAKGIDSVTPGPWGSGLIILYYALASAGKAPSKAAIKKALSLKAKLMEKLAQAIDRNRQPKMTLVAGKSSKSDPLKKLTSELDSIADDKKQLEKDAEKTADFALEIGEWAIEHEDADEALDALLIATVPAHERLVSQGDEYDSMNLLDMSMYLADSALEDLKEGEQQGEQEKKMAAGPRFE